MVERPEIYVRVKLSALEATNWQLTREVGCYLWIDEPRINIGHVAQWMRDAGIEKFACGMGAFEAAPHEVRKFASDLYLLLMMAGCTNRDDGLIIVFNDDDKKLTTICENCACYLYQAGEQGYTFVSYYEYRSDRVKKDGLDKTVNNLVQQDSIFIINEKVVLHDLNGMKLPQDEINVRNCIDHTIGKERITSIHNALIVRLLNEQLILWERRKKVYQQFLLVSKQVQEKEYYDILEWYKKEYEVLPLWYKRVGHIIKYCMRKRYKKVADK